jgi:hypothetical protein
LVNQPLSVGQTLLNEIEESNKCFSREKEDGTFKRDVAKRIELKNWVLENMKNPNIQICDLIESRMDILSS